jgi:hypothetical protein
MNRIAAKIAQEIGVLFKNDHGNAGAGEQITQHHACGATARDAATRFE